jgi:hypothetical protein
LQLVNGFLLPGYEIHGLEKWNQGSKKWNRGWQTHESTAHKIQARLAK